MIYLLLDVTASVESFKERLNTAVAQQLAAADTVMKETIKESISSKVGHLLLQETLKLQYKGNLISISSLSGGLNAVTPQIDVKC